MLTKEVREQLKKITSEYNTTQASIVNELVKFGLENANFESLDLEQAKPRGRKPTSEDQESNQDEVQ